MNAQNNDAVKFSIIICTYNQCASLEKVLGFLSRQVIDNPSSVELLIIDNNSSDNTKQMCGTMFPALRIRSRYIFESEQGLSAARNRGAHEADGDILIFTDDDAKLPADWVQSIVDCYREHKPDCVFGKIIIDWEFGIPEWYSDSYKSMFVGLDYGDTLFHVDDMNHEFYGKNFSLVKDALIRAGGFDKNLGRKGDRLFIGEETKLYRTLIESGRHVVYNPDCVVFHMLKDIEYTLGNFEKRYLDACISEYYMLKTSRGKKIFGRPLYVIKKLFQFMFGFPALFSSAALQPSKHNAVRLRLETKKHMRLLKLWLIDPEI